MKRKISYTLFITFWTLLLAGQNIARVTNVKIESQSLNQERELLIYTPVDYDWRVNESFNVIYVFDSQNREFFDYTSSMISFLTDNSKSFIVVGITSPYNESLDYARNNDMLPVLETEKSKNRYGSYSGNVENFFQFVSTEVIPYIDANYRTLNNRLAVGHSLSASFVMYSFLKNSEIFNNYIAVSPNLAYDDHKLAELLIDYDYAKIDKPTYIYLSHADEGINYWQHWKPAREKVYDFFNNTLKNDNLKTHIKAFPDKNHWSTFPPGLESGLKYYFENIFDVQDKELSTKEYVVTINVKVLGKNDTLYITGNQDNLGNWSPNAIKMNTISDLEREIKLKLKSPAQVKFTRGSWDSEAEMIGAYRNVIIKPEEQSLFEFEIENYIDTY